MSSFTSPHDPEHLSAVHTADRAVSRPRSRVPARLTGLVGGGAAIGLSAFAHASWWVYLIGVMVALVPAALPQESEHRRDFYRDYFRHREQMVRIRQESPRRRFTCRYANAPEPPGEQRSGRVPGG